MADGEHDAGVAQAKPRRRVLTFVGASFLLLIVSCSGWLWWSSQRGWTVAKLELLIKAEIPRACDRATVEAWFERHNIECYWSPDTTQDLTVPQTIGRRKEELSGDLSGYITDPDANVDLIAQGMISIHFYFDSNGHLTRHRIDSIAYVP